MTLAILPAHRHALLLLGGGGHALVVADAARLAGWMIAGYLDDRAPTSGLTHPAGRWFGVLADLERVSARLGRCTAVIPAVGDNETRLQWLTRLSAAAVVVHPSAAASESSEIGAGAYIGALASIGPRARIGRAVIVNTGAIVEHECVIEEGAHVAPGAALGGDVMVGARALIGIRASVLPGVRIGAAAIVGAGSVVTRDVPSGVCVRGVPARETQQS